MAQGRTFEDGQRARELFDQGMSCNGIAKTLGVSPSTISGWAKREGLSFDRGVTEAAVNVLRVSRAARRSAIIDRLYDRSEAILDRLEAPTYMYRLTAGPDVVTFEDEHPPSNDEKNLASSIGMYLERAAKLEAVDDQDGVAEADSMLGRLAKRFGLV
jgi:hypothetical protein